MPRARKWSTLRSRILSSLALLAIGCGQDFDHHLTIVVSEALGHTVSVAVCKPGQPTDACALATPLTAVDQDKGHFYLSDIPAGTASVGLLFTQGSPAECQLVDVKLSFPRVAIQLIAGAPMKITCDESEACAVTVLSEVCD